MKSDDKVHEECAVFGVYLKSNEAAGITYNGLLSLQHRGQEGAGIAVVSGNAIVCNKGLGLVREVFSENIPKSLPDSRIAIGHNRYSTTGVNKAENVQPFVTEYLTGRIATVHNGNIINAKEIREKLKCCGISFSATSDSEVISSLIAYYSMKTGNVLHGVTKAVDELKGAFSLLVLSSDNKLIAIRDPDGCRPLCLGQNETGIAIASESCAFDSCGFNLLRDVKAGEIIVIENNEVTFQSVELHNKTINRGICIFEYVYFARPDSIIDNLSVFDARYNMGRILAKEYPVEADVVCGVPDSGLDAAIGYSVESGIPLVSGFVKNRYIGRSFIYPSQMQRESAVRLKLNPLTAVVKNKKVVLVDDSIVRGTTCEKIVNLVKNAGAKEVHMRISSPPFRFTCHLGTDIDNEEDLIANRMSLQSICKNIDADSLGHISIEGLKRACEKCRLSFCTDCFTEHTDKNTSKKREFE